MPARRTHLSNPNEDTTAKTVSIPFVSARYDVDEKTVRRWISQGLLRGYRVGPRLIRVNADDVDALLRPIPTTKRTA